MDAITVLNKTERLISDVLDDIADFSWVVFVWLNNFIVYPVLTGSYEHLFTSVVVIASCWGASLRFAFFLNYEKSLPKTIIRIVLGWLPLVLIPLSMLFYVIGAAFFEGSRLPEGFWVQTYTYAAKRYLEIKDWILVGLFFVGLSYTFVGRVIEPAVDRALLKITKQSNKRKRLNDVRHVHLELPLPEDFTPLKYFRKARKKGAIFFGLDGRGAPVYIHLPDFQKSNILLVGPTRRGKGVQATVVLVQCIWNDEPSIVIVIDPKGDDWGPCVLKYACEEADLPFIYVNARRDQPPQFNILLGATKPELIVLLIVAYDLTPKGTPDDFYRLLETEAIERLVGSSAGEVCIADLYNLALKIFDSKELEQLAGLIAKLRQDAALSSVNGKGGPSINDLLSTGGVFWFVGSEDDPSVSRMQRLLGQRAVQILRNRDDKSRHATIFADELKHILSGPFYKNFGTILGAANANILGAIQSKGDLEDIPQNLNPRAVSKAIFDNCNLKWIYRSHDPETIDWVVAMEGSRVITKQRRKLERNAELAELTSGEVSIADEEIPFLHRNHVLHLPDRCAILIGDGVAKFAYTSPIKVPFRVVQPTHIQSELEDFGRALGDELL